MACFLLQSGDSTDDLDRHTNRPVVCLIQIFRGYFSETSFLHNYAENWLTFKPESVVRLPFLFSASVSRVAFGFIVDVAGYTVKKRKTR